MIRKALKLFAIVVVAIVGLFFAVAIVLPSSYTLERSIEISRPPALVYSQVTDYNTWLEWSPWPKMDPGAKQTVSGTPGTVGMSKLEGSSFTVVGDESASTTSTLYRFNRFTTAGSASRDTRQEFHRAPTSPSSALSYAS